MQSFNRSWHKWNWDFWMKNCGEKSIEWSSKGNVGEWSSSQGLEGRSEIKAVQLEQSHRAGTGIPVSWERQRSHLTNFGKVAAKNSNRDGEGKENEERETIQSTHIADAALIEREEWSKKAQVNNLGKVCNCLWRFCYVIKIFIMGCKMTPSKVVKS